MKLLILLLIGSVLTSCSNPQYEEKLIKRISTAYVKKNQQVYSPDQIGSCSSVFVSYRGKIRHITNSHCCPISSKVYYNNQPVKINKVDTSVDLCELSHKQIPKLGLFLSSTDAELGDKIYISGFPTGHYFSIAEGHVTTHLYRQDIADLIGLPLMKTNAFLDQGGSGGAVINSSGYLIGIASVMYQKNSHGAFIPVSFLKEFLK